MPINYIENTTFTVNLEPHLDGEMIYVVPHLTHMARPHAFSDAKGKPIFIDRLLHDLEHTFVVEPDEFARVKDKLLKNERTQVAIYTSADLLGRVLFPPVQAIREDMVGIRFIDIDDDSTESSLVRPCSGPPEVGQQMYVAERPQHPVRVTRVSPTLEPTADGVDYVVHYTTRQLYN
jgi:hypothetical protein